MIAPTGPDRAAFAIANVGCAFDSTTLFAGATATGLPITTGVKTWNEATAEYGPVFAPSCARARQKYVRADASASGSRMLVRPLPGVIPSRVSIRLLKLPSPARSNL